MRSLYDEYNHSFYTDLTGLLCFECGKILKRHVTIVDKEVGFFCYNNKYVMKTDIYILLEFIKLHLFRILIRTT